MHFRGLPSGVDCSTLFKVAKLPNTYATAHLNFYGSAISVPDYPYHIEVRKWELCFWIGNFNMLGTFIWAKAGGQMQNNFVLFIQRNLKFKKKGSRYISMSSEESDCSGNLELVLDPKLMIDTSSGTSNTGLSPASKKRF